MFPLSHQMSLFLLFLLFLLMSISGDLHGFTGLAAGVLAEAFSLASPKSFGEVSERTS